MPEPTQWVWLEEYRCGCWNETKTKKDAVGYCAVHGENRRRITKVPQLKGEGNAQTNTRD